MDQSVPAVNTTKISQLAKRPKRSNQNLERMGQYIPLITNHFRVNFVNPKERIILYSIKVDPDIPADSRDQLRKILTAAQGNIEAAGVKSPVFRGWNIWSSSKVDQPFTAKAMLIEENKQYTLQIQFVGEFNYEDIEAKDNPKAFNPVVQTVNIAVRDSLRKLKYFEMGRSSKYYDPRTFNDNTTYGGIKVWRGYKTSLHVFEQGLYLLIDFQSRVLRQETALQMIDYFWDKYKRKLDVKAEMVGLSVIANYGNHRIYKIDDIDFDLTPRSTFMLDKFGEISYMDYYKKLYSITIRDPQQPLLVNRDKRNPNKVYNLIPELMLMTGLTDNQRADFRLMKDVAQFTKLTPEQRNNDILKLRDDLVAPLKTHNIILDKDQSAQGFQLYPPKIKLGKGKTLSNDTGFFIIKEPVLEPALIKDWVLIYQSRGGNDDREADFFLDELQRSASFLGIQMKNPGFVVVSDDRPERWISALKADFQKNGLPQLVVSIVPDRSKGQLYPALKEFLLCELGVISQVVLTKFMQKKDKAAQIASKIAQQINAKIGNALWYVPVQPEVGDKTMLVGIDIYHKLVKGNQSCVGVVASVDPEFTKYWHKTIIMKKGQELIQELAGVICEAIVVYFEQNQKKYLPERIIIYRDGVGESQVHTLLDVELTSILNGFKNVSKKFEYNPQCAFIMINKKINHRFFAIGGGDQGARGQSRGGKGGPRNQLVNPPSGTIMAEKIVTRNFDFFLSSQYVTEGTCTPTHFQVLYNTTDWSEETFWALTYHQCFNYWNWTGAVRVPACVQYAKKLAFLTGDTFKKSINDKLEIGLCFL